MNEDILITEREHDFCIISKDTFGQYNVHDIQTNSSWGANPYGDSYAVVPDSMVKEIMETSGFCEIELNEEGTEVVSFTALPIPEIPEVEPKPSDDDSSIWDEMAAAIAEGVNEV